MKTLKIILTIFMAIIIIVVGVALEALAFIDFTLLNPWFYTTGLRHLGFYENLRGVLLEQIETQIDSQDAIPGDYKADVYEIVDGALSKKTFSKQLGDFFGGTMKFVLYGKGDGIIPLNEWINSLEQEVASSEIAKDIVDAEIKNNTIKEEEKDYYYEEYERVIVSTTTELFDRFSGLTVETSNFSEVFYIFLAPNEKTKIKINDNLWVIRYWVKRAVFGFFIGLAIVLLLVVLLTILCRQKKQQFIKFLKITSLVNSIGLLLMGGLMFFAVNIANALNKIPSILISYLSVLKAIFNSFAIIILCFGTMSTIIFVALCLIEKKINLKEREYKSSEIFEADMREINYTEE